VLILDFSLLLCLVRAMRRSKERLDFWWWLITWRRIERPRIKRIVAQYAGHAEVHVFSNPDQLERYLSSIESGRPEMAE